MYEQYYAIIDKDWYVYDDEEKRCYITTAKYIFSILNKGRYFSVVKKLSNDFINKTNKYVHHVKIEDIELDEEKYLYTLDNFKTLISQGANIIDYNNELVVYVSRYGDVQILKYLVEQGINIKQCVKRALYCIGYGGKLDTVKYLVEEYGADIHDLNEQPLRETVYTGRFEIFKYLLDCGAKMTISNDEALIFAAGKGNLDFVKYLIEQGADINYDNRSALREAIVCNSLGNKSNKNFDVIKFLINNGVDVKADNGESLILAARDNEFDIVKYFLEIGINQQINEAMCAAAQYGRLKVIKLLVEYGADIRYDNDRVIEETTIIDINGVPNSDMEGTIRYLIDNGIDFLTKYDALINVAKNRGHSKKLKLLEELDSGVEAIDSPRIIFSELYSGVEAIASPRIISSELYLNMSNKN